MWHRRQKRERKKMALQICKMISHLHPKWEREKPPKEILKVAPLWFSKKNLFKKIQKEAFLYFNLLLHYHHHQVPTNIEKYSFRFQTTTKNARKITTTTLISPVFPPNILPSLQIRKQEFKKKWRNKSRARIWLNIPHD